MRRESVLAALLLTGLLSATAVMGEIKVDPGQKYLLLATQKTSTMQKELAEAAGMGFRVLAGSPTSGTEMAIFLERVTEQPSVFEYLLLATTRTGTMNKELNREGAKGFRLLRVILGPRTHHPDDGNTRVHKLLQKNKVG